MNAVSVWQGTAAATQFPSLDRDIEVDAAIVGGGITGVTLAMLLASEGKRVVLLEGAHIGYGTTGNSTGNLYSVVNERLHAIRAKWGGGIALAVAESRRISVDFVEQVVQRLSIPCDFARVPLCLYAASAEHRQQVEQEYEAASSVGLECRLSASPPFAFASGPSLILDRQAQFHPLCYVTAIAHAIASERCRIFENTRAVEIDDVGHSGDNNERDSYSTRHRARDTYARRCFFRTCGNAGPSGVRDRVPSRERAVSPRDILGRGQRSAVGAQRPQRREAVLGGHWRRAQTGQTRCARCRAVGRADGARTLRCGRSRVSLVCAELSLG